MYLPFKFFIKKLTGLLLLMLTLVGCINSNNTDGKNSVDIKDQFMVVTQGENTTKLVQQILKDGGNIVDAAIAASFSIGVERPQSTGIGGGGFLIYYQKKLNKVSVLDFRERAPITSTTAMYQDKKGELINKLSLDGPLSVATPGLVAGMQELYKSHSPKLEWHKLLAPSVKLARSGFKVYPELAGALELRKDILVKFPSSKKIFFKGDAPLSLGDQLIQDDLASTLEILAKNPDDFYHGRTSKKIIEQVNSLGGILSARDFSEYTVKNRNPIIFEAFGKKIISMPPPSSGGIHIAQILKLMEKAQQKADLKNPTQFIHFLASSMQLAFADRSLYLGDPDFHKVPTEKLTSDQHLTKLFATISKDKATKSADILSNKDLYLEGDDTTHFTIADNEGNVIVSTQTINYIFGSGLVAEGTGIVLNDEMDDFTTKLGALNIFGAVGGIGNKIEPKKTPLSSMSPTIVLDGDKPILALGTPNGTRIITCVAQTILNYIYKKMPLMEAVRASRIHHQLYPEKLFIGEPFPNEKIMNELKKMGHEVELKDFHCRIQAIGLEDNKLIGVSDPRGEGVAAGI